MTPYTPHEPKNIDQAGQCAKQCICIRRCQRLVTGKRQQSLQQAMNKCVRSPLMRPPVCFCIAPHWCISSTKPARAITMKTTMSNRPFNLKAQAKRRTPSLVMPTMGARRATTHRLHKFGIGRGCCIPRLRRQNTTMWKLRSKLPAKLASPNFIIFLTIFSLLFLV